MNDRRWYAVPGFIWILVAIILVLGILFLLGVRVTVGA